VFWKPTVLPGVLVLVPLPDELRGSASPASIADVPFLVERRAEDGLHRLVAPGPTQLWLVDSDPPAQDFALLLPLGDDFLARMEAALAFWRLVHEGRSTPVRAPTPQRRFQLIQGLRALDARQDGASYREIATALFGAARVPTGRAWKTHDLRSRTLRLVGEATRLMDGGYRDLLRSP